MKAKVFEAPFFDGRLWIVTIRENEKIPDLRAFRTKEEAQEFYQSAWMKEVLK